MAVIEITAPVTTTMALVVKGIRPLLIHCFGSKAKKQIAEAQAKRARIKKAPRDPWAEFWDAMHWRVNEDGSLSYGFPATAFKKAAMRRAKYLKKLTMKDYEHLVDIHSHDFHHNVWVWGELWMHVAHVRVQNNSADIRFRPCLVNWGALIVITYNQDAISQDQVFDTIRNAGIMTGIGDWRPVYGRFFADEQLTFFSVDEALGAAEEMASKFPVITPEDDYKKRIKVMGHDCSPEEALEILKIYEQGGEV